MAEERDRRGTVGDEVLSLSAHMLLDTLALFGDGSDEQRERELLNTVTTVKTLAKKDVIAEVTDLARNPDLKGTDFRRRFKEAVESAGSSRFKVETGVVKPWVGGFTVTLLDPHGRILAAEANPQGEVYSKENYGDDLYAFALAKAVLSLHLDKMGKPGGLDNEENLEYLKELGFKLGEDLFLGEAQVLFWNSTLGAKRRSISPLATQVYIGASGCEMTQKYVDSLLPSDMHAKVDFLAGFADQVFAQTVSSKMVHGIGSASIIEEPELFAHLRRAH